MDDVPAFSSPIKQEPRSNGYNQTSSPVRANGYTNQTSSLFRNNGYPNGNNVILSPMGYPSAEINGNGNGMCPSNTIQP